VVVSAADPDDLPARIGEGVRVLQQARARDNRPAPPQERGVLLGTLPSGRGEMRLSWFTDQDRAPAWSNRLWVPEDDGQLWPVRGVGVSIPIHQMVPYGEAYCRALELAREYEEQRRHWRRR
jgi:hypothetical protein